MEFSQESISIKKNADGGEMFNNKKIIAIIPARSGSKGLKDKNIKDLNGKPLIGYTIESATDSRVFDEIIVSTDSEKYAQISRDYGANVPFLRSNQNSTDNAGSWDVVREVLSKLDEKYDVVVLLQPTSPLRTAEHIKEAIQLFFEKNADTLCSVCETPHPMFWCNTLDENLSMKDFVGEEYRKPRQQLPKSYTINGAIYICKTEQLQCLNLYSEKSFAYVMPQNSSVDIDSELDFKLVELIMKNSITL